MLPEKIALRLKADPRSVADSFEEVSVLFLDIVAFTPLAESMLAKSVVKMLNDIFSKLDDLADKYELEKIKTIGDAYMVAAGIPYARADHCLALGRFALEASSALTGFNDRNGEQMEFRIGLNSGPLVAGVIGREKYSYDLWGDTVNTAAHMESHGTPGQIQCTRAFQELAIDYFEFERRGQVEIKGKGKMETFFLVGLKGEA
jgi:class 3 adenylate cyclase